MGSRLTPEFITWLQELRREFHQYPELSLQEVRTTARVIEIMKDLGLEVRSFTDMPGAVGVLKGAGAGASIALRADMDALPIQETCDVSWRSRIDGQMHACGHDAHTSIMLGVAKNLVESGLSKKMTGDVIFIFQPAEETGLGAKMMIDRGILEEFTISKILACHVSGILQAGQVGVCPGVSHAQAKTFQIKISGKGAHGARPHQAIDSIVATAHLITAIQTIVGRNLNPGHAGVISVGSIVAGKAPNVIPDHADLTGTIRAFDQKDMTLLCQRLKEICKGIEHSFQTTCKLEIKETFPLWTNDKAVCDIAVNAANSLWSTKCVEIISAQTGSEDFGYFTQKVPGAMIRLGCANSDRGLKPVFHASNFDFDEKVLGVGVELFTEIITQNLTSKQSKHALNCKTKDHSGKKDIYV